MGNTVMNRKKNALKASASHSPATPHFTVTQCASVFQGHTCAHTLAAYTHRQDTTPQTLETRRVTVTWDRGHKNQ